MPESTVTLSEGTLKAGLRELVRKNVEDTLSGPLEEEAGDLVGAGRYESVCAAHLAIRAGDDAPIIAAAHGLDCVYSPGRVPW